MTPYTLDDLRAAQSSRTRAWNNLKEHEQAHPRQPGEMPSPEFCALSDTFRCANEEVEFIMASVGAKRPLEPINQESRR